MKDKPAKGAPKRIINKQNQDSFAKLLFWARDNQAEIQEKMDAGKTMAEYAAEKGISNSTMSKVLHIIGITFTRSKANPKKGKLFNDLLVVVARIAKGLDINYDEIKPYLPVDTDAATTK